MGVVEGEDEVAEDILRLLEFLLRAGDDQEFMTEPTVDYSETAR